MQPADITDTIITGILPTPTRVLGQKQTVVSHFHVSGHLAEVSHFQGMTSPIIDFPQIRAELPEYWVTLHLYVWQCVQVCMTVCMTVYDSVYRYVWLSTGMNDSVYRYVWQCVQVWGNTCKRCLLTKHWVNLRVLAKKRRQATTLTNFMVTSKLLLLWKFLCFFLHKMPGITAENRKCDQAVFVYLRRHCHYQVASQKQKKKQPKNLILL